MSWFRVDDNLHAHRKARRAGAEAMGLWVMCGSYASSLASDGSGALARDEVEAVALTLGLKSWQRAAEKLVSVGLWRCENDGYAFHDWDQYRPGNSEAAMERRREKDAARKKATYVPRRQSGGSPDFSAEKIAETPQRRLENSPHPPVPSRPDPSREEKKPSVSKKTGMPADWNPMVSLADWLRVTGVSVYSSEVELVNFRDRVQRDGVKYVDWDAGFRTWIRNAIRYGNINASPPPLSKPKAPEPMGELVDVSAEEMASMMGGVVTTFERKSNAS